MEEERKDFCTNCRKETKYVIQRKEVTETIRNKEYTFIITVPVCSECGGEMSVPGFLDQNAREIDEQYRKAEGIISTDDIKKLMELYNIGKNPLSLALGFGEVTIARYLSGQIPSKEYSDIMKKALTSPQYMKQLLNENKDKIADTAYNKAFAAADALESLFSVSREMLGVIAYIFKELEEVTPLMLQKLLYYIQGIDMALYDKTMFPEDCEAWAHGPVYPEVYYLFRDFKYNPIDDIRFTMLDDATDILSEEERSVIDLVINTFGLYGGKALEKITHGEEPWEDARKGYAEGMPSNEPVSKEAIKSYFKSMNKKYNFGSEDGINQYIQNMLHKQYASIK